MVTFSQLLFSNRSIIVGSDCKMKTGILPSQHNTQNNVGLAAQAMVAYSSYSTIILENNNTFIVKWKFWWVWCTIYCVLHTKPHNITGCDVPYTVYYTPNTTISQGLMYHILCITHQTPQYHGVWCTIYCVLHTKPHNITGCDVPYTVYYIPNTTISRVWCTIYCVLHTKHHNIKLDRLVFR